MDAGLSEHIEIALQDYRDLDGQFDAVLSCEMIEAVGQSFLSGYFKTISNSLKPGSRAVIQAITIPDERYAAYCRSCDWIQSTFSRRTFAIAGCDSAICRRGRRNGD